jgi:hypothetical protein
MLITVADKCLLYSESDRIAAWPRNDAKCQSRPWQLQNRRAARGGPYVTAMFACLSGDRLCLPLPAPTKQTEHAKAASAYCGTLAIALENTDVPKVKAIKVSLLPSMTFGGCQ